MAMIYFCRCYKWGHETNEIFKIVDKEVDMTYEKAVASSSIPISGNSDSGTMDWTEMGDMSSPQSGKNPSYQRSGSKDSMEVIFFKLRLFLESNVARLDPAQSRIKVEAIIL